MSYDSSFVTDPKPLTDTKTLMPLSLSRTGRRGGISPKTPVMTETDRFTCGKKTFVPLRTAETVIHTSL